LPERLYLKSSWNSILRGLPLTMGCPRLNSIIYINPNAKAEAAALEQEERAEKDRAARCTAFPSCSRTNIDVAKCRPRMDRRS